MRRLPLVLVLLTACGGEESARTPREAWRLRCEVVVTEDGAPVEAARVFSVGEARSLGRTDDEGRLVVWVARNDQILATRGEGVEAPAGVGLFLEAETRVEVPLAPPLRIRGRVVRDDGTPVPRALVALFDHPAWSIRAVPEDHVAGPTLEDPPNVPRWRQRCRPPVDDLRIPESDEGAVRADGDGFFELHLRVTESIAGLAACAPHHGGMPLFEPGVTDFTDIGDAEITLYRLRPVRGTVVDVEGAPVAGANVEVKRGSWAGLPIDVESLVTDDEGRFLHEAHPEWRPWFEVRTPAGLERVFHPGEEDTELRIRVAPTSRQVIRVRCGEDAPRWAERVLSRGRVRAHWLPDGDLAAERSIDEDRSGWHAVLELPNGRHELELLAPCGVVHREVELADERAPVTLRFPLDDAGTIELRTERYVSVRLARAGRMLGTVYVDSETRLTGVQAGDYVLHPLGRGELPVTVVAGETVTLVIGDRDARPER